MRMNRRRLRVDRVVRRLFLLVVLTAGVGALVVELQPVYVTDEVEALARVIRSEAGISPPQHQVHVAWATRNLAGERRQSIAQMACSPCGPQQRGRPVSSSQSPTDVDRHLARHVLASPRRLDPTGGATHFVNPALQDQLAARGVDGYRGRPYRHVRRQWTQVHGWRPYYRLGPDLELWGPPRR
jgi:hypothetical protein